VGVIGAVDGVGIFFAWDEPFKTEIFIGAILKGILVALLTALSLMRSSAWWQGALYGLHYGFVFALVIFLAKGGLKMEGRSVRCAPRGSSRDSDRPAAC
jgi:hypothetical protein